MIKRQRCSVHVIAGGLVLYRLNCLIIVLGVGGTGGLVTKTNLGLSQVDRD